MTFNSFVLGRQTCLFFNILTLIFLFTYFTIQFLLWLLCLFIRIILWFTTIFYNLLLFIIFRRIFDFISELHKCLVCWLHKEMIFLKEILATSQRKQNFFGHFIDTVEIVRLKDAFNFGWCSYLYWWHFEYHFTLLWFIAKVQSELV